MSWTSFFTSLAGNETARKIGLHTVERLGEGVYSRISQTSAPTGEPVLVPVDRLEQALAILVTRDEMATAFAVVEAKAETNQRLLMRAFLGLAVLSALTLLLTFILLFR